MKLLPVKFDCTPLLHLSFFFSLFFSSAFPQIESFKGLLLAALFNKYFAHTTNIKIDMLSSAVIEEVD